MLGMLTLYQQLLLFQPNNMIMSDSTPPPRSAPDIPALAYRGHRADMIMTYNILHHNLDINPSNFFQLHTSTATRGHNYKIYKPHAAKNIRNHFFAIRVINHCNNLPWAAVNSPSVNDFKRNIDDYYYPQSLDYNLFV